MTEIPITPLNEDLVLPLAGEDGVVREYHVKPTRAGQFVRITVLNQALEVELANGLIQDALAKQELTSDQRAAAIAELRLKTPEQESATDQAHIILLGKDCAEAMIADEVLVSDMQRACSAARIYHVNGCDVKAAMAVFDPKVPTPRPTPKAKTGAVARTTRRRSSGSGTSSQPTTK